MKIIVLNHKIHLYYEELNEIYSIDKLEVILIGSIPLNINELEKNY